MGWRWSVVLAVGALGAFAACSEEYTSEPSDGGATTPEGGTTPATTPDAMTPVGDAGGGGTGAVVHCGLGVTCAVGETCCVEGQLCSGAAVCTCSALAACDKPKHYECDDPTDCAEGLVCCGTMVLYDGGPTTTLGRASCLAPKSCNQGYNTHLCDPASPADQCARGRCNPSTYFPGLGYCE